MDGCPDCQKRKALTEEQDALWPLQVWLRKNSALIIEPHLNHFKDSLSYLSELYDKQKERIEKTNARMDALEKRMAAVEKDVKK